MFTDAGVSFYLKNTYPSKFDFTGKTEEGWAPMEVSGICLDEEHFFEALLAPAGLLKQHRVEKPFASAVGIRAGCVRWMERNASVKQIAAMDAAGIPATVMVLEAWSDEETFYIWNGAEYTPRNDGSALRYTDYNFLQDGPWPNPKDFCKQIADRGLKLILWQIPVIKYEAKPHGKQLDLDEQHAIRNRLCLMNDDGNAYRIPELWFSKSLVPDFTNPETCRWWFD